MNKVLRFSLGAFLIVFLLNNRSAFAETMSLAVLNLVGVVLMTRICYHCQTKFDMQLSTYFKG